MTDQKARFYDTIADEFDKANTGDAPPQTREQVRGADASPR